ncbi:adenine phosphoribosyltransferase [Holotrichia oblita]|uniref:Adenine phosphoribosyltransferase n=1 Tax=Holotrichia oblita TaxID=644536 RepID=A0ACB9TKC8_HOLOL|nr:adenine phosphoribosyltransferase [Holotrichia oblita]
MLRGAAAPTATDEQKKELEKIELIKKNIGLYPDFPKAGVLFRDTCTILRQPNAFQALKEVLVQCVRVHFVETECIGGLDARGFLIGPIIALELRIPFIPIRKRGKLPGKVTTEEYTKEYGKDAVEIQDESVTAGAKILLVDDLLATGGSLQASCNLIEKCYGK